MNEIKLLRKTINGMVNISFTMDYNGQHAAIENISIVAPFELPYKQFTGLEIVDNKYKLYFITRAKEGMGEIEVHNYYDDKLSDDIAEAIGKKKEEYTPRFEK